MGLTALGTHIDSLYLSVYCELPPKIAFALEQLRNDAQASGDDKAEYGEMAGVPGGVWYIMPYGRGKQWRYVLENASFFVAVCDYKTDKFPRLDVQFKAETLYEYGTQSYAEVVRRLVRGLFGLVDYELKVSRADVCVDFQLEGFGCPEIADVVTRARKWQQHGDYGKATGLILGRGKRHGALEAKIYNKSVELEQCDKPWMYEVWRTYDGYSDSLPVWRAEVTMYREGLAGFEVSSLEEFLGSMGDLLGYVVAEEAGGWLRICDRETRHHEYHGNHQRRSSAGWWSELRSEFLRGAAKTGRKRKGTDTMPSLARNIEMAGAYMARAAALYRLQTGDMVTHNPEAWGRRVGELFADLLAGKGSSWAEKMRPAMHELRGKVWRSKVVDGEFAEIERVPADLSPYRSRRDQMIAAEASMAAISRPELTESDKLRIKTSQAASREDRSPVPSSSTLRLIEVRPSIKHEAGFYVSR